MTGRITAWVILAVLGYTAPVFSQPILSYLIPDIGTPGMNTYVEFIGPFNRLGNFGKDGVSLNNRTDSVKISCANASDTQYVRIGPCIISWDGRMIATQIFIFPWVKATAVDWQQGIKIPLKITVKNQESNIDTFYIVKPQTLGVASTLSTSGAIGSGGIYGKRSRRGAMIVDSLTITGSGRYSISTADCDQATIGNQGYLPAVLIGKGKISIANGVDISVAASGTNGGPGGGGGGGDFDEVDPEINNVPGGDGFTGGQGGHSPGGIGSGGNGTSGSTGGIALNGVPGGIDISGKGGGEGTGGGTGFCFGQSGTGGFSLIGGYGGGSGGLQDSLTFVGFGGGGAGFATKGTTTKGGAGNIYGNRELIPMMGGSGGAGGNPFWAQPGTGGGGGGCLSLYSQTRLTTGTLTSVGAVGLDDTASYHNPPGNAGSGGGGSGGAIIAGAKTSMKLLAINTGGGKGGTTKNPASDSSEASWQNGGDGGDGRVRLDGVVIPAAPQLTGVGSIYNGITTAVFDTVTRTFTLSGTGTTNLIQLYVCALSGNWIALPAIGGSQNWSTVVTLPGNDSVYFLVASQKLLSSAPTSFLSDPPWLLSQAGANILFIRCNEANLIANPASIDYGTFAACSDRFDTIVITNTGCSGAITSESVDNPSFGVSIINHISGSIAQQTSDTIIIRLQPSASGAFSTAVHIHYQNGGDLTIPIIGNPIVNITALPSDSLLYGALPICEDSTQHIAIANFSCDSLTIIQVVHTPNEFIASPALVGKGIKANDSLGFSILLNPTSAGIKNDSLVVKVRTVSGAEQLVTIHLLANVLPKQHSLTYDKIIRLDSLAPCTAFDTIIYIHNTGVCDTISLTTLSINNFQTLEATSDISKLVPPGDSIAIALHFDAAGSINGNGTIQLIGRGLNDLVTIIATSRKGGIPFTVKISDSIFAAALCNPALRVITFKNASCAQVVIDAASLGGSGQFIFAPIPTLPIIINPGDSTKISIQFDPSVSGDSLATFSYHSQTGNISGTIDLRGTSAGSKVFASSTLAFDANSSASQAAGSLLGIDYTWQDNLAAGIALTTIKAKFAYNDNILTPQTSDITVAAGWSVVNAVASNGSVEVTVSRSNTNPIGASTVLANVPFFVTLSDVDQTTITLPSVEFNNGDPQFATCVLSPLSSGSLTFTVTDGCGKKELMNYLATGKILSKIEVIPNPLSQSGKELVVKLSLSNTADLHITLSDILGRPLMQNTLLDQSSGDKEYHFTLGDIARGSYLLRIATASQTESIRILAK